MSTHQLIIMRHAKSDWSSDTAKDFERPLSKRGIRNASQMGAWLKSWKIMPDCIISSPALRTKMTAHLVCEQLGFKTSGIIWDDRIYEAGLDELLAVITDNAQDTDSMLLIGHNPGLDTLLSFLSKEEPQHNDRGKLMTTGAIAILNYDSSPISTRRHSARLEQLVRPKELTP